MNDDGTMAPVDGEKYGIPGHQRTAMNSIRGVRLSPISTTRARTIAGPGSRFVWIDSSFDSNSRIVTPTPSHRDFVWECVVWRGVSHTP
jgi:hypothetical protein